MAAEFKTVNIKIVASGAGVKKGTDEAKGHLTKLESKVKETNKAFSSEKLLSGLGIGLGGLGAFGVAKKAFDTYIESANEAVNIANKAETTGFARATIEGFKNLFPDQFEPLLNAAEKYNALIGAAAEGNEEAEKTLQKFGLEWEKLIAMSPQEAMAAAFDKIAAMPDKFSKSSALRQLFGRGGVDILRTAEQGGDILGNVGLMAIELDDPHTEDDLEKARELKFKWRAFITKIGNITEDIATAILEGDILAFFAAPNIEGAVQEEKRKRELNTFLAKQAAATEERIAEAKKKRLELEEKREKELQDRLLAPVRAIQERFGVDARGRFNQQLDLIQGGIQDRHINWDAGQRAILDQITGEEKRLGLSGTRFNLATPIESGSVEAASVIARSMAIESQDQKSIQERLAEIADAQREEQLKANELLKEISEAMDNAVIMKAANVF